MNTTQPYLPFDTPTVIDRSRLREARNDAARTECRRITGKRLEVFEAIGRAGVVGLTMREMAGITGRGINCWTQPFADLRDWGVIETTDQRRNGGTVHRLIRTIEIKPNGDWE